MEREKRGNRPAPDSKMRFLVPLLFFSLALITAAERTADGGWVTMDAHEALRTEMMDLLSLQSQQMSVMQSELEALKSGEGAEEARLGRKKVVTRCEIRVLSSRFGI